MRMWSEDIRKASVIYTISFLFVIWLFYMIIPVILEDLQSFGKAG